MRPWWQREHAERADADGQSSLVVEAPLHEPSRWKRRVLEHCSVLVSNATAALLAFIRERLVVTPDVEDATKIASADLAFEVGKEHASRIAALLAQVKHDRETGERLPFSNAYRFTACEPVPGTDRFRVVARLADGTWRERKLKRGGVRRTHGINCIHATTGFQQLLATYAAPKLLHVVPPALRAGVCQEVAQQVLSYLGQLESSKVRGDVAFPTVEDRDPVRRRQAYEDAIDALVADLTPFSYAKLRDKFPGEYAADDPRGDRLIVDDPRWFAVTTTPDPHPIPLLFSQGSAVRLLEGSTSFDAGVSKRNRHRGSSTASESVRQSRPDAVQRKGTTGLRQWYAAIPLLDADDDALRAIAAAAHERSGRQLDLALHPLPLDGGVRWRRRERDVLVPLSGDRKRLERILRNPNLHIAWSRLVQKRTGWVLQLTVRIPMQPAVEHRRVLGVSFGIDAVATWSLVDEDGVELEHGALAPNEQILTFLREKRQLEWDQEKGRWIGKQRFAMQLESIAHGVANTLLAIAEEHHAVLAVEDVSWVKKAGPNHAQNVLFTAWNFGQLRRILSYKSPMVGRGDPVTVSDYVVSYTCPTCGACRKPKQKPDHADTWRDGDTLSCRSCGFQGVLSPSDRARRVTANGLTIWQDRWQRSDERNGTETS